MGSEMGTNNTHATFTTITVLCEGPPTVATHGCRGYTWQRYAAEPGMGLLQLQCGGACHQTMCPTNTPPTGLHRWGPPIVGEGGALSSRVPQLAVTVVEHNTGACASREALATGRRGGDGPPCAVPPAHCDALLRA